MRKRRVSRERVQHFPNREGNKNVSLDDNFLRENWEIVLTQTANEGGEIFDHILAQHEIRICVGAYVQLMGRLSVTDTRLRRKKE